MPAHCAAPTLRRRRAGGGNAKVVGVNSCDRHFKASITFKAAAQGLQYPRSISPPSRARSHGPSMSRSTSPSRKRFTSPPHLSDMGRAGSTAWSTRTLPQRPDLSRQWLAQNQTTPFYTWEQAFDRTQVRSTSPASAWGRDRTGRSSPSQWTRTPNNDGHFDGQWAKDAEGTGAVKLRCALVSHSRSPTRSPSRLSLVELGKVAMLHNGVPIARGIDEPLARRRSRSPSASRRRSNSPPWL